MDNQIPVLLAKVKPGEALLWYIDSIDSKFTELKTALEGLKAGEFTQSVAVLDKMRFYKSKRKKRSFRPCWRFPVQGFFYADI